ncbi:MAG: hypothetical protein ACHQHN_08050 [Sphingobacteriales bacterium]
MLKIFWAILMAMACAMFSGGSHKGTTHTVTTQTSQDSTGLSGGDSGHIHP